MVHTPNGLPAKDIPVKISVSHTKEKSTTVKTDDEGIAFSVFNFDQSPQSISVEVSTLKDLDFFSLPISGLLGYRHPVNLFSLFSSIIMWFIF